MVVGIRDRQLPVRRHARPIERLVGLGDLLDQELAPLGGFLDHFRGIVEAAGGGNYQSLINDALVAHIQRQSVLIAMRKVVREELAHAAAGRKA
jgi:hypothetical protein